MPEKTGTIALIGAARVSPALGLAVSPQAASANSQQGLADAAYATIGVNQRFTGEGTSPAQGSPKAGGDADCEATSSDGRGAGNNGLFELPFHLVYALNGGNVRAVQTPGAR